MYKFFRAAAMLLMLPGPSGAATALAPLDAIALSPFADGEYWHLLVDLDYALPGTYDEVIVKVPRGFVTDFASVPQPFWSIIPPWGEHGPAAVVHDWLYWSQECERRQADRIMALAMKEADVSWLRQILIYPSIRIGGYFSWRANQSARNDATRFRVIRAGMRRPGPVESWEDYRKSVRSGETSESALTRNQTKRPVYCSAADQLWTSR